MGTLLLQLVGPMQSWGVQSHFTHRDTGLEPSKSGVIGLICAAMGKTRDENHPANADKPSLERLSRLRMGVRVDREGLVKLDYHTAQDVMKAGGKPFSGLKTTELSDRFYLADAAFLVGLESNDAELLRYLYDRLRHPVWMLYLGRKAFVPGAPVWLPDGLKLEQNLEEALHSYPRISEPRYTEHSAGDVIHQARMIVEDSERGSIIRPDQPVSFAKGNRKHTVRYVRVAFCDLPEAK
ncbi:MAG: type I-E CRISPR-associated protein Cas5/CasD [Chloroflexi bacterium]|nr:MAG: type I-E CRISPR-associated protein Cas5/CasD [Chloroflexota bacterium]RLC87364.1 MAG: type I-E CRISPR-associated protein Cas5/CasD [Chloroflexota bacterium]